MSKNIIAVLVLIVSFGVIFIILTEQRDRALMKVLDKYEACVEAEYHMTPSQFYNYNGSYPECDSTK